MIRMITLLVLVSLIRWSKQDPDDGVSLCGPQNLRLSFSDQTILSEWEDDPSCAAVNGVLVYELLVLRAEGRVHHDEVAVTPDQIGSTHFWRWTSPLALECISHSVRLRSRYQNRTSPWKRETLPGTESGEDPEVYPRDKMFHVGSRVTFCCVLPPGQTFDRMYLTGYHMKDNASWVGDRTYALTLDLNQATDKSCTTVKCKARNEQSQPTDNGACASIGYPPGDKDLQCETRDLESVDCHWTVGGNMHLAWKPTTYQLLGRRCDDFPRGRCSQNEPLEPGERTWTLTAQNDFGTVELSDRADLTRRVHMLAPEEVTASAVCARNVSLAWRWTVKRYKDLNITCQVNVSQGRTSALREDAGVGLDSVLLTGLMPKRTYAAYVRCITMKDSWKWSEWSPEFKFQTRDDVPDALDVWMQMKKEQIIIIWKIPTDDQSHGHIIDYTVSWAEKKIVATGRRNATTVDHSERRLALSVDATQQYLVTVTARNTNGSSSPATITTPHFNPDPSRLKTSRFTGSNGSVGLSWSASPAARCGYVVDWRPTASDNPSIVDWLKVPPHETNVTISSTNFQSGLRYSFSIFACTQAAPVLLERREGYAREEKIQDGLFKTLKWTQKDSDVEVSWRQISPAEQSAFIQGYILYWSDNNKEDSHDEGFNVSTGDPDATSLTARNLKISSFTFRVKARTAVGECGTTPLTVTLNSLTDDLILAVFVSLATVFALLSLVTVVCYRHWACIKQSVYPPIPKPLLTDKWLKSMGEHSCRPLYVDQCPHSEADIMDIPELLRNAAAPLKGHVGHEDAPFAFSQTPKGYINQPLKNPPPPALILPTEVAPAPAGLPSSPFRGLFPNPSYNLVTPPESGAEPEPREAACLECDSDGYQPHSSETFTHGPTEDERPMSCVFAYVLLPQSTA